MARQTGPHMLARAALLLLAALRALADVEISLGANLTTLCLDYDHVQPDTFTMPGYYCIIPDVTPASSQSIGILYPFYIGTDLYTTDITVTVLSSGYMNWDVLVGVGDGYYESIASFSSSDTQSMTVANGLLTSDTNYGILVFDFSPSVHYTLEVERFSTPPTLVASEVAVLEKVKTACCGKAGSCTDPFWNNLATLCSNSTNHCDFYQGSDAMGTVSHLNLAGQGMSCSLSTIAGYLNELTELQSITLSMNSLTGPIMDLIGGLPKLTDLNELLVAGNPGITGTLPQGSDCTKYPLLKKLAQLLLSETRISGPLSECLFTENLSILAISNTLITGPLPTPPANSVIWQFYAEKNAAAGEPQFAGTFNWGSVQYLQYLYIVGNAFTGTLTLPQGMMDLEIDHNGFNEIVLGSANSALGGGISLTTLTASFNNFQGMIPTQFTSAETLNYLDFTGNALTTFPSAWNTPILRILILGQNQLSGPLPAYFAGGMQHLYYANFSYNQITDIADYAAAVAKNKDNSFYLVDLYLNNNQIATDMTNLNLTNLGIFSNPYFPYDGIFEYDYEEMEYEVLPFELDLESNALTGSVPASLFNDFATQVARGVEMEVEFAGNPSLSCAASTNATITSLLGCGQSIGTDTPSTPSTPAPPGSSPGPSPTPTGTPGSKKSSSGLDTGAKVGIAIGVIAGFFLIVAIVVVLVMRRGKSNVQSSFRPRGMGGNELI